MVSAVLQFQIEDAERCWSRTCGTPKTAESPPIIGSLNACSDAS
jgi:hypothetical protein